MSRDGNGNYSLPEAPFVYDTVIDETAVNSNFSDIASALTASIARDGQTPPTANLPMATYRHTGVGNASARDQYVAMGQVQDGAGIWCGTAGGTADALTLTPSPAITAYAAGQRFDFKAGSAANTGAVTFAISGLSAIAGQVNGAACTGGEIAANQWYRITLSDASTAQIERIGEGISGPAIGSGKVPQWNGSAWAGVTPGAGTVTSIIAGTGLTGGTITSSGTVAVDYSTTNTWSGVNTYSKALRGTPVSLTSSSASIATDASAGNFFTHTFTENTTLANPSNLAAGQEGVIVFTQHASSPKTLAYGSYWKFSGGTVPSVTATNSAVDVLVYYVESSTRITAKLLTDVK